MIKDTNDNVLYYGRLKNIADTANANGTVEIDLSGKLNSTAKLYIFNEQYRNNSAYIPDESVCRIHQ